jgi:hypothetical protein
VYYLQKAKKAQRYNLTSVAWTVDECLVWSLDECSFDEGGLGLLLAKWP